MSSPADIAKSPLVQMAIQVTTYRQSLVTATLFTFVVWLIALVGGRFGLPLAPVEALFEIVFLIFLGATFVFGFLTALIKEWHVKATVCDLQKAQMLFGVNVGPEVEPIPEPVHREPSANAAEVVDLMAALRAKNKAEKEDDPPST